MDIQEKTTLISLLVLLICIVIGIVIYIFTGIIFVAIIFAPPIVHWILKKREEEHGKRDL